MRNRVMATMSLVVTGCALMLFWFFQSIDSTELGMTSQFQQMGQTAVATVRFAVAKALKPSDKEQIRIVFKAIEESNQPINFWGKVLDQNDQPIAGVKVRFSYSIEHGTLSAVTWGRQENRDYNVITDAAGAFYIGGMRGHVLEIVSHTKQGYFSRMRGVLNYDYYGSTSEGRFHPSQDAPIIFAIIEESAVKDISKYGDYLSSGMQISGDGVPVRWAITESKPDPGGEIQFTFKRNPVFLSDSSQRSKWELKVELIGGSIMEASPDDIIYRAPEQGYLPSIYYPILEQKRGYPNREFYFKTANNNYGRLHLDLYADDEGESARLYIQSWLNSSGGRLLEAGRNP